MLKFTWQLDNSNRGHENFGTWKWGHSQKRLRNAALTCPRWSRSMHLKGLLNHLKELSVITKDQSVVQWRIWVSQCGLTAFQFWWQERVLFATRSGVWFNERIECRQLPPSKYNWLWAHYQVSKACTGWTVIYSVRWNY